MGQKERTKVSSVIDRESLIRMRSLWSDNIHPVWFDVIQHIPNILLSESFILRNLS